MVSLILATSVDQDNVFEVVESVGFDISCTAPGHPSVKMPRHRTVQGLRLQIKKHPTYFRGVDGVVTEIEFDALEGELLDNAPVMGVLRDLYGSLQDLRCREPYMLSEPTLIRPVSEILA